MQAIDKIEQGEGLDCNEGQVKKGKIQVCKTSLPDIPQIGTRGTDGCQPQPSFTVEQFLNGVYLYVNYL